MKTKQNFQKVVGFALSLQIAMMVAGFVNASKAANDCENSTLGRVFGCSGIFGGGNIDLASIIQVIFNILIAAAILWTAYHIILAGFKIVGGKEDASKREEGIKAVTNAALGLVVVLLAGGATFAVTKFVGGPVYELTSLPCFGKDSDGVGFAGFVKKDDPDLCVLTDANGKVLKEGPRSQGN